MIDITSILAPPEWTDVRVRDHKKFWLVSGSFNGQHYSATGRKPLVLAKQMDETARATVLPPRKAAPEPPKPAPIPEPVAEAAPPPPPETSDDKEDGEPLPDTLAAMVPESVAQKERKAWLRDRWQQLNHKIHGTNVFGAPSPAEVREHEELERYRGLFA